MPSAWGLAPSAFFVALFIDLTSSNESSIFFVSIYPREGRCPRKGKGLEEKSFCLSPIACSLSPLAYLMRADGRKPLEMRPVRITRHFLKHPEGSVLISLGETRVICTASVEEDVPRFLRNSNQGWVTSEYAMIPRSTQTRMTRESATGRVGGRTHEIQRLIGRSLRSVVDLFSFGKRTIWMDCDVIQADGGTRTAAITGAFVALADAFSVLQKKGALTAPPLRDTVAAISVGMIGKRILLDLPYEEDSRADVDMNFVITGKGGLVEVQGTAERTPFTDNDLQRMMATARKAIAQLTRLQKKSLCNPAGLWKP
jgi:ribonuclease PH